MPVKRGHVFTAALQCVSTPCGPYAAQFNWGGIDIPGRTGYYVYQDNTQVADVVPASYVFHGVGCGVSFRMGVKAHDGSGGLSPLAATTYSTPACPASPGGFFGVQTIGSTPNGGMAADVKRVNAASATSSGELTKVTMYLSPSGTPGTQTLRNVIYSDSGGNPSALLGVSDEIAFSQSNAAGWYDLILPDSVPVTTGTTYWMGMITGPTANVVQFNFDTQTNAKASNVNLYSDGPADPFGAVSNDNELMSVYATVAPQLSPANTARPTLSGTAAVGSVLTTTNGTWSPTATNFSYRWQECDTAGINCQYTNGVLASRTVTAADSGHTIRSVVLASNAVGSSSRTSAVSSTVPGSAPGNTALPSITGSTTQGQTLSVSTGTWTGSPTSYSYQWRDCDSVGAACVNATGAGNLCSNVGTGCNYVLTAADVAHTMRVVVTATNASGSTPATSPQSALVAGTTAPLNTALPVISGTTTVGSTLATTNGTWTSGGSAATCGGGAITCTYQWQRCSPACSNLAGATATSYTLVSADLSNTIDVVVTATNAGGSTPATSAQTATITNGGSGATLVGTAGSPTPACTATVNASAGTASVDAAMTANAVVCLTGTWSSGISFGSAHTASNVTIRASTPGAVTVNGFNTGGCSPGCPLDNVTIEGFRVNAGFGQGAFCLCGENIGDTLRYNTIEGLTSGGQRGSDFFIYNNAYTNGNYTQNNNTISYNQEDNNGQCVQIDNGAANNTTYSHNVCGPNMGVGGGDIHYVQADCQDSLTIANNAFLGPPAVTSGHLNVYHGCGAGIKFDNNLIWKVAALGDLQLGDDGTINPGEVKNNLIFDGTPGSSTFAMQNDARLGTSNFTVSTNTAVGDTAPNSSEPYGMINIGNAANETAQNDISVFYAGGGGDLSFGCSGTCVFDHNVTNDSSAPGSSSVTNWTPTWCANTSCSSGTNTPTAVAQWVPTSGSPWVAPPAKYLAPFPSGSVTTSMGYQGPFCSASTQTNCVGP